MDVAGVVSAGGSAGVVDQMRLSQALAAAVEAGGPDAALAVCRAAVAWLPMTGVAITVMAGAESQEPVCATDAAAARIDELQFSLGDGPCVESYSSGRAVLVADITDPSDGRWPVFAEAATATGARGMYVFPLHVGATKVGVLDCYRDTPGSLSDRELTGALRAADAAVWTLLDHVDQRTIAAAHPSSDWFDAAALVRAEVHQATGMLIAQGGIRAPAALARLRGAAFTAGRGIAEVAEDVLARRLRLDLDGSWHPNPDGPDTPELDTDEPGTEEPG